MQVSPSATAAGCRDGLRNSELRELAQRDGESLPEMSVATLASKPTRYRADDQLLAFFESL
jgi:hypothetical protein